MWSHWRFRRREVEPESVLRRYRAEPREEFVRGLSEQLHGERPARRTAWSRLAFAGAVSTLILGMFASFGGVGYATSGAATTYHAVKQVVVTHKVAVTVHKSSAQDEYGSQPEPPTKVTPSTSGEAGKVAAARSGTLPFTGYSLLATVVVGSTLLGIGLILRRRERRDT
jgi:hypothetical protein